MDLRDKKVLITGAARRIGRAIAHGFAERGSQVLIHYRNSHKEADELVAEVEQKGVKAYAYQADLTRLDALQDLASQILDRHDAVDVLINNASWYESTPVASTSEDQWDRFMAIHLKAPFFLSRAFAPGMKRKGEGRIINIVDVSVFRPQKNYVPYVTSKGGLLTMTRGLAKDLAPEVLVNAVCPGPIIPPEGMSDKEQEAIRKKTLLQRWGTPEDIAKQVVFLAEQDYATGGHYLVDGGQGLV